MTGAPKPTMRERMAAVDGTATVFTYCPHCDVVVLCTTGDRCLWCDARLSGLLDLARYAVQFAGFVAGRVPATLLQATRLAAFRSQV